LTVRRMVLGDEVALGQPRWRSEAEPKCTELSQVSAGAHIPEWRSALQRAKPTADMLQVSGTSWVAQMRKQKEAASAEVDAVRFEGALRGALNKLTVEKFDPLSEQIISLISKCSLANHGIPLLMQLVFEKATSQHHFIPMYVNLCLKLHKWLTANARIAVFESQTNFKRILLNQCQSSFEQYLEPAKDFEGLRGSDAWAEANVKYKTKMLGNIKLVGELINHGMLAPKIALAVAAELARDDPSVLEERLETLAVFLEKVSSTLDDRSWSHFWDFDAIFTKVQRFVRRASISTRVRFLLRDVLDARRAHWQVQKVRDLDTDAPMKLEEVHLKAKQEQGGTPSSWWAGEENWNSDETWNGDETWTSDETWSYKESQGRSSKWWDGRWHSESRSGTRTSLGDIVAPASTYHNKASRVRSHHSWKSGGWVS